MRFEVFACTHARFAELLRHCSGSFGCASFGINSWKRKRLKHAARRKRRFRWLKMAGAVKLNSLVFGRPTSAAPLTVLHGMLGSARNWRSLGPRMAEQLNRLVYVPDARNHGDSPHTADMTFTHLSRDVVQFLKERKVEKTVLVGHSMGGTTAMFTALKYPQLVEGLVVLDSSPESPRSHPSPVGGLISLLRQLDLQSLTNRREADEQLKDKIPSASLRDFLLTNLHRDEETGQLRWKVNLEALQRMFPHLSTFPDVGGATYTGPTLFLGGGNSDVLGESALPVIEWLFPNSTVQHIPGAGHLLHVDQPKLFLSALQDFIHSLSH